MPLTWASPIRDRPRLVSVTREGGRATACFAADEPVLAGHYPGAPIVPGVCVLELVHQTVRQIAERRGIAAWLTAITSARFLHPVQPGEVLDITVETLPSEAGWTVRARVATEAGRVAETVLAYETWRLP